MAIAEGFAPLGHRYVMAVAAAAHKKGAKNK